MAYVFDPAAPEANTPLMKQYLKLKAEAHGAILFFRMGDFYEVFGPDAEEAAPILSVTLTARDKKSDSPIPMAGVPFHSITGYIQKLLAVGKKVCIAEQMQDPDSVKGLVDRQIVRTFTPAINFELSTSIEPKFMATVQPEADGKSYALVLFDPATGMVRIAHKLSEMDLLSEVAFAQVKHFLASTSKTPAPLITRVEEQAFTLVEEVPSNFIADKEVLPMLQKQYDRQVLPPLLDDAPSAQKALAMLVRYLLKSQGIERIHHIEDPRAIHETDRMILGPNTFAHLDLEELFKLINQTATSMGARHLRGLLEQPFRKTSAIEVQQAAVRELAAQSLDTAQMHERLREVYDLDRILGRITAKLASPRDTFALGRSLQALFELRIPEGSSQLKALAHLHKELREHLQTMQERILRTQRAEAPIHTREGGVFEMGTDPELDRLIGLTTEGEKFLIDLEAKEREATGINSLKVKYNRVFGYFIEISTANLKNVPSRYQRKQTMVGGERFFTEELKKFEEEILTAETKKRALEQKLFEQLLGDLIQLTHPLKKLSELVGALDSLVALSKLAQNGGWCFPEIDESQDLKLQASRHPVVDQALRGKFVPNDIEMTANSARTLLITGPNMGGKSTLMRQMAQVLVLGQLGAPVPATSARWGVVHSLYTRIGAHDAIVKGQSTFMVEMVELAHILRHANDRSFVVLDEIGRGTATYDGMSVAWAALEYLHQNSRARIVFATHYHELTELEASLPGLKNAYMKVEENKPDQSASKNSAVGKTQLLFLYELALGRSSKSFGIQVAELAGLPKPVIKKAWDVLKGLESTQELPIQDPNQLSLFATAETAEPALATEAVEQPGLKVARELHDELSGLDIASLRPIEALQLLDQWKARLVDLN
ncbi:MAG: DNA mismatch repair protein MutS [Bdellovibrionales bacterium]|nr:DNA mismatch repair protein MutS [Bdellovibrionales bacterium]